MKKKIFRFLYTSTLDIEAKNEEEAEEIFEELDLNPEMTNIENGEFRNLIEMYEIDKNGIRKE